MKKFLTLLLAFALVTPSAAAFKDSDSRALQRLVEKNVLIDKGHFLPEIPCTREQFLVWTLKNIGEDVTGQKITEPFTDVNSSQSFAPFVARAWELGVIKTGKIFGPKQQIRKIDALKILLKLEGLTIPRTGFELLFIDAPRDAEERGVVAKAIEMRITEPLTKKVFGTYTTLNRLECAKLIDAVSLNRKSEESIYEIQIGKTTRSDKIGTFERVFDSIESKYLRANEVDMDELVENAIKSTVDSLGDPHTVYFNKNEVNNFLLNVGIGSQYGIGAQVGLDKQNRVQIVQPLLGSPAEQAGLKPGDVVIAVDGVNVANGDFTMEEVVTLIKGENGTTVQLKILRGNRELEVEIVRAPIVLSSLVASEYEGYLLIQMFFFGNDTAQGFRKAIQEHPTAAANGIILDLRNNPGGFLDSAIDILASLLPENSVAVKTRGRDILHTETVRGPADAANYPLVILVNERSASASEIVAGGIQDNNRGVVIGTQTYGKGTAQELLQFADGSALKLTIAEWLTPNDRNIDQVGIEPDFIFEEEDTELQGGPDEMLNYATRILQRGQWKPAE